MIDHESVSAKKSPYKQPVKKAVTSMRTSAQNIGKMDIEVDHYQTRQQVPSQLQEMQGNDTDEENDYEQRSGYQSTPVLPAIPEKGDASSALHGD